jgi:hypothetical protein
VVIGDTRLGVCLGAVGVIGRGGGCGHQDATALSSESNGSVSSYTKSETIHGAVDTVRPMLVRVAALGLTLAVTGSASAAAPRSPCRLATTGDVRAAFGGSVGAGKLDNSIPGAPTCRFSIKHSNLGLSGTAVVFITPGQSAATFRLAKKEIPGAVSVSGVGAAAFYNPHTNAVELLKGNTVASAQGIFLNPGGRGPNPAKIKADVIALAKSVAKHV